MPQNRERIYIIGFNNDIFPSVNFSFPPEEETGTSLNDILEENPCKAKIITRNDVEIYKKYLSGIDLFGETLLPNKPIQIGKINKGGQGERIYDPMGHAITLSANGGGVGSKTGVYRINGTLRKLSPRECARLQGFPESFVIPDSVTEAQKQFGNSISINVVQAIVKHILDFIDEQETEVRFQDSEAGIY